MVNINLTTEDVSLETSSFSKQLIWIIIIFLVIGSVYAGVLFYKATINKKTAAANVEYAQEYEKMKAGNARELLDFQNRLNISGKLLTEKNGTLEILQKLEAAIVPGAYIYSLAYDGPKKTAELSMKGDSYDTAAKQVLSLKNSEYFPDVSAGKTAVNAQGGIDFGLSLKLP